MAKTFTPEDRVRLAPLVGTSAGMLYQAFSGNSNFKPIKCVDIEKRSKGEIRRWDLRPADWFLIWPELVGTEGAPEIPKKKAA
jgi:DNA-binding transcriptional regulator YdaS (Cro superfamily)